MMRNMEILREGDIPYFEALEKEGNAVIIRLDLQTLLSLDPYSLYQDHVRQQMPTDEQVKDWLTEHKAIIEKHVEEQRQQEPEKQERKAPGLKELLDAVRNAKLNREDQEIIEKAIGCRFQAEDILSLLDESLDTGKRSLMFGMLEQKGETDEQQGS